MTTYLKVDTKVSATSHAVDIQQSTFYIQHDTRVFIV